MGRSATYSAVATDTAGAEVASPSLAWDMLGEAAKLENIGTVAYLRAQLPGDVRLTVQAGSLAKSVRLHAFNIERVRLAASELILNVPPPAAIAVAPGYQVSSVLKGQVLGSDPIDREIAWEVSRPDLLQVVATGLTSATVAALPGTAGGLATVTARAFDDPKVVATASVIVRNRANLLLEIE